MTLQRVMFKLKIPEGFFEAFFCLFCSLHSSEEDPEDSEGE